MLCGFRKLQCIKLPLRYILAVHGLVEAQHLIVLYLKVSNVYDCNLIDLSCIDAYKLFAAYNIVILRPLAC